MEGGLVADEHERRVHRHARAIKIDDLGADIQTELEDLIVAGDGLGEKLHRLMTVAGTQTLVPPVAPASNLDNIRKAMTLVRVNARCELIAVVLSPTDVRTPTY